MIRNAYTANANIEMSETLCIWLQPNEEKDFQANRNYHNKDTTIRTALKVFV